MTENITQNTELKCEPKTGRPVFPVYLVTTNTPVTAKRLSTNIQLTEQQFAASRFQGAVPRAAMPNYEIGGLILITSNGKLTHVGTVTSDLEDVVAPSIEIFASAIKHTNVSIHRPSLPGKTRPLGFAFVADTEPENLYGRILQLGRDEADRIRKQIGPFVHAPYRNVYWTEMERQEIDAYQAQAQADEMEQARFQKNIAAMIAEMERLNAAA